MLFIVTDVGFVARAQFITSREIQLWLNSSDNILPENLRAFPLSKDHYLEVYIYEFEKTGYEENSLAKLVEHSPYDAQRQLKTAGIWKLLWQSPSKDP